MYDSIFYCSVRKKTDHRILTFSVINANPWFMEKKFNHNYLYVWLNCLIGKINSRTWSPIMTKLTRVSHNEELIVSFLSGELRYFCEFQISYSISAFSGRVFRLPVEKGVQSQCASSIQAGCNCLHCQFAGKS